jgi:serine/threonine protein kinase
VDGGNLYEYLLLRKSPLPENDVRHIAAQLVVALDSLHRNSFIYRDLKLENIMISTTGWSCGF